MRATSVTNYTGLLDAVRARMAELELTYEILDHLSGVQVGYSSKILGPRPVKAFGPVSLGAIMGASALRIVVEPDEAAAARMRHRWVRRRVPRRVPRAATAAAAGESVASAAT